MAVKSRDLSQAKKKIIVRKAETILNMTTISLKMKTFFDHFE